MPSCRPDIIPNVIYKLMEMKPKTILEVGIGFGKWGVLCKEYLKFWCNYEPVIDGVEAFSEYKSGAHNVYRTVFYSDIISVAENLKIGDYDLLLMIDVIEHLKKEDGANLLSMASNYLVSTPAYWAEQGAVFGNEYERHVSKWAFQDFAHSQLIKGESGRSFIMGWKK